MAATAVVQDLLADIRDFRTLAKTRVDQSELVEKLVASLVAKIASLKCFSAQVALELSTALGNCELPEANKPVAQRAIDDRSTCMTDAVLSGKPAQHIAGSATAQSIRHLLQLVHELRLRYI